MLEKRIRNFHERTTHALSVQTAAQTATMVYEFIGTATSKGLSAAEADFMVWNGESETDRLSEAETVICANYSAPNFTNVTGKNGQKRRFFSVETCHRIASLQSWLKAAAFSLFIASCSNNRVAEETSDLMFAGDTVTVSAGSAVWGQIVVKQAQIEDYSSEFRTVGTVRPVAGKLADIAPPFAGRITQSFIKLGQNISAGSPVFEISSAEFHEAVKSYFSALDADRYAQRNFNRQKDLMENGVASQKDFEQAQSDAYIAQHELEQAKSSLKIFNIDIASLQPGQSMKVISPISGNVVKYNITLGSYVKDDAEPLAVVADLSKVWVAAIVKEGSFGTIKHGDRVEIYTDAHHEKIIHGSIYYIGEMLDEETRSLEVIVECDNSNRDLKLGMFCDVHFLSAPERCIVLPATAIMQQQDNDCVFVEISKGVFVLRRVTTVSAVCSNDVRIINGISEGENVVVKGSFYLK